MTNNLPELYKFRERTVYDGSTRKEFSEHATRTAVENHIQELVKETVGTNQFLINNQRNGMNYRNYRVSVIERLAKGGYQYFIRVSIDGEIISSKKNEMPDFDKVVTKIIERAIENEERYNRRQEAMSRQDESKNVAEAITEETGIRYSDGFSLYGTSEEGKIQFGFKKDLTPEQAKALINFIKTLN